MGGNYRAIYNRLRAAFPEIRDLTKARGRWIVHFIGGACLYTPFHNLTTAWRWEAFIDQGAPENLKRVKPADGWP